MAWKSLPSKMVSEVVAHFRALWFFYNTKYVLVINDESGNEADDVIDYHHDDAIESQWQLMKNDDNILTK